jgi:hypothetical protein
MHGRVRHTILTIALAVIPAAAGCGGSSPTALSLPPGVHALAVAPDFAGTIWAPTPSGDYRSQDGGHSWQRVPGKGEGLGVAFTERWTYLPGGGGSEIADFGGRRLTPFHETPAAFVSVASPYHRTNRLYAVDDAGRTWLSIDAGRRWRRMRAEGLPPGAVSIAAVRDAVTAPDTIYVSAGDDGLWRSTDFGGSFVRVPGVPSALSAALTTDDQRLVLVATGDGLLRSGDRGRTFVKVSDVPATVVAFDPRNRRLAYAAAGDRLLRSVDGGRTWPS